jgi:predicted GNAT family acetyltransferase
LTLLEEFDRQLRRDVAGGENLGSTVIWSGDGWHGVIWSDLDERNADAAIARAVSRLRSLGGELEWKLYGHDCPADLPRRLEAAGLVPGEEETVLVAEVTKLDVETPLDVRVAADREAVQKLVALHDRIFGEEHTAIGRVLERALEQDQPRELGVLCYVSGEPVSAARIEFPPGCEFATLWGGCTLPEQRGRGAYRATLALRARLARERGCRYLVVDALPTSRPILERLGFTALTTTTPYTPA